MNRTEYMNAGKAASVAKENFNEDYGLFLQEYFEDAGAEGNSRPSRIWKPLIPQPNR